MDGRGGDHVAVFRQARHRAVIVAMDMAGADEIYTLGGVQGIGAMAIGTETTAAAR